MPPDASPESAGAGDQQQLIKFVADGKHVFVQTFVIEIDQDHKKLYKFVKEQEAKGFTVLGDEGYGGDRALIVVQR